jgi:hypothetical protein
MEFGGMRYPDLKTVRLDDISDGGAQMRTEMSAETVADYAEEMVSGTKFPAIVVYYDGTEHWLADGYHRVEAARKIGRETTQAEIRDGSSRDATLHAIGANASHGLRRTQADKRRAVVAILADKEWARWSDRKIAQVAKVDHKTVGKIRREHLGGEIPSDRTVLYRDRHGNATEMQVRPPARSGASVALDLLKTISNDDLISECRRRGFEVEAPDAV